MKVIAIANQKGGVGKTTTAAAIGLALAGKGKKKVLLVDTDVQCNLTSNLQVQSRGAATLTGLMLSGGDIRQAIVRVPVEVSGEGVSVDILPGSDDLNRVNGSAVPEGRLKALLKEVSSDYDYCVIDTPPNLGPMTINALVAADGAVIPATAATSAKEGVEQLLVNVDALRRQYNPGLRILGVIVTAYDSRAVINRMVRSEIEELVQELNLPVLPAVRRTKAVVETEWMKTSLFVHAPKSTAAQDYRAAADSIEKQVQGEKQ